MFKSAFVSSMQSYTTHTVKQHTGLCKGFSCDLTHSTAYNTRLTQAAIIPPAPRRALYRPAQPPYYNNVYKGAGVRLSWIHARQCSISQTMLTRRGQLLPCVDRWQVLTRCQQYRPAAPADGVCVSTCTGSARRRSRCFPRPAACNLAPGQRSGRTGSVWHPPPGGAVQ